MNDFLTVIWKELRELRSLQGTRPGLLRLGIVVGLFGVVLPLQHGPAWVVSPASMFVIGWLALFLTGTVIPDTFAGERERHTLETLLSMPLSDRAILAGKTTTGVLYGWSLAIVAYVLSIVALSQHGGQGWILPRPLFAIGAVTMGFLGAWLSAGVGVLVSLRAATARQAYQTLNISFLLIILVPTLGFPLLPVSWRRAATAGLAGVDDRILLLVLLCFLFLVDIAIAFAASRRFQRARLILD